MSASGFYRSLVGLISEAVLEATSGPDATEAIMGALRAKGLDAVSIDRACCAELRRICAIEYEDVVSKKCQRNNGRGWSTSHIRKHMHTFLKRRIREATDVIDATVTSLKGPLQTARGQRSLHDDGPHGASADSMEMDTDGGAVVEPTDTSMLGTTV
jgi:hypothetical protein